MRDPNQNIAKLLDICRRRESNALVEIQAELEGARAYNAICENLGIKPIMDAEAYNCVRPDIARKRLLKLFEAWCLANFIPLHHQHVPMPAQENQDCRLAWEIPGMPLCISFTRFLQPYATALNA